MWLWRMLYGRLSHKLSGSNDSTELPSTVVMIITVEVKEHCPRSKSTRLGKIVWKVELPVVDSP